MYLMLDAVTTLFRAILIVLAVLAALLFIGFLMAIWLTVSLTIWGHYGDTTFMYWLIGSGLALALFLVIIW